MRLHCGNMRVFRQFDAKSAPGGFTIAEAQEAQWLLRYMRDVIATHEMRDMVMTFLMEVASLFPRHQMVYDCVY